MWVITRKLRGGSLCRAKSLDWWVDVLSVHVGVQGGFGFESDAPVAPTWGKQVEQVKTNHSAWNPKQCWTKQNVDDNSFYGLCV